MIEPTPVIAATNIGKYGTAMMKTIIKGVTTAWTLDGKVDFLRLLGIEPIEVEMNQDQSAIGIMCIWDGEKEYDPTT